MHWATLARTQRQTHTGCCRTWALKNWLPGHGPPWRRPRASGWLIPRRTRLSWSSGRRLINGSRAGLGHDHAGPRRSRLWSYRRCGLRWSCGNWCRGLDWRSHRWSNGNLRRRSCRFRYRCGRRCRGACRCRRYLWGGSRRWRSHRLWRRWRDRTAGYGWPHRGHDHARCRRRRHGGLRWNSYRSFCRRCCWLDFGDWRVGCRGTRRRSRGGSFLADGF